MKTMDGKLLKMMILSGANHLDNQKQAVNDLNVFPVPDGDTGTNMGLTIAAARKELLSYTGDEVGQCSKKAAGALLRGARGNSGVILSLLFRGFASGMKGKQEATPQDVANGWKLGVQSAYKAVMKPTEGTILTVARLMADRAVEYAPQAEDMTDLFTVMVQEAEDTLQKTPDMLPVLKQAGVVDAGGRGLVVILEGMLYYLKNGEVVQTQQKEEAPQVRPSVEKADFSVVDTGDIHFAYCTEFIVQRDDPNKDAGELRKYLESIGDCVVVVDDEEIIKVHVHTNHPGNAFEKGIEFGMLCRMKVENMKEQHERVQAEAQQEASALAQPAQPEKQFGFVVVAAGDGIASVFRDLGADVVVQGGQTMNPSTEDILDAVARTPAHTVFVLPNNKNIIMAANQAQLAEKEKTVIVIPSKTIPQGVSAMLNFDADASAQDNQEAMQEALTTVHTGQLTYAARDSVFDGHEIKEGEILGLVENQVTFTGTSMEEMLQKVVQALAQEDGEIVTVYYGQDVKEEDARHMQAMLEENFPDLEFTLVDGGQPIYYYLISVE